MAMREPATPRTKARLEARIDVDLDDLITEASTRLGVTKTAFVCDALREAALRTVARADVMMMPAEAFDALMATIEVADPSPELDDLAALPRLIAR